MIDLAKPLPYGFTRAAPAAAGGTVYSRHPLVPVGDPGAEAGSLHTPQALVEIPGAVPVEVTSVHPLPPLDPANTRPWHDALRALPAADPDGPARILAGDFNATLDHAALRDVLARGYTDAAAALGEGLRGTWPVGPLPKITLDHVLVDARIGVGGVDTHEPAGGDHRAVSAELTLPAA
ncbi:endonuclease/exonuclease/phosphatase family protein [Nocardiopsis mangrovi]|uniref:Endonuclease/exonuclease/phosphatase family protein n=1 Tax=Nocardiopsis mangrovi TaxID=1179818 RepID=A0ABV9DRU4_9ACTN